MQHPQNQKKETIFLGFGHKTKHGKDTAAAHIAAEFGDKYDVKRYAFAHELKLEFYAALCDPKDPYWQTTQDYFLLPHPALHAAPELIPNSEKLAWIEENKTLLGNHLQLYGTEYRRAQDKFYWVKALDNRIACDNPMFALITDVRFPNEALYVKAKRGYTVKANRLGYINPDRNPSHISETALDDWKFDFVIDHADGNVQELLDGAVEVFNHVVSIYDIKMEPDVFAL